jgi:hypothetical protein
LNFSSSNQNYFNLSDGKKIFSRKVTILFFNKKHNSKKSLKHFQSVKNKNFSFYQNEKNLVKNQIKEFS